MNKKLENACLRWQELEQQYQTTTLDIEKLVIAKEQRELLGVSNADSLPLTLNLLVKVIEKVHELLVKEGKK